MAKEVPFFLPSSTGDARKIQMQQMMAQMLMSQQKPQREQTRIVPRESMLTNILPALSQMAGMYMGNKATQGQEELKAKELAALLEKMGGGPQQAGPVQQAEQASTPGYGGPTAQPTGGPQKTGLNPYGMDPQLAAHAYQLDPAKYMGELLSVNKPTEFQREVEGAGLTSEQKQQAIARKLLPTEDGFTLSPGQARFDAKGQQVVSLGKPEDADAPSNVREWQFYQTLQPDQQKQYLEMKRNTQALQLVDVAGGKQVFNRASGNLRPVSTVEQEAGAATTLAAAEAGGKATGTAIAEAKLDFPRVEANGTQMLGLLGQLKTHPGRAQATGASSMIPMEKLAGTPAADFVALLDQIGGKQFLEAFNSLKGGGAITESEGKKATDAISRIQKRNMSEPEYLKAIEELEGVVSLGVERARRKAGGAGGPKQIASDADYESLPSGAEFIAPDGTRRRKP